MIDRHPIVYHPSNQYIKCKYEVTSQETISFN